MEKRSWLYCEGILRGWKRDGFNTAKKDKSPLEGYTEVSR